MSDFPESTIEIRLTTDNWGPFVFDFTNRVPSGDSIASLTVSAHVGEILPEYTLAGFADISSTLVETNPAPSISGNTISLYLKWPGNSYKGENVTLVFQITFTTVSGIHPFYFYKVAIQ